MISRLLKLFGGGLDPSPSRQVDDKPDVIDQKIIIPRRFRDDIDALQIKFGDQFTTGLSINLTLREALQLMPRERKRVDSYNSLKRFLGEQYEVQLTIKSNKTRL